MRLLNWLMGRRPTTARPEDINVRVTTTLSDDAPDGPVLRLMTAPHGAWPEPVDLGGAACTLDYTDAKGRARSWQVALLRARQSPATVMVDVLRAEDGAEIGLRLDRIRALHMPAGRFDPRDFLHRVHGAATATVAHAREVPPDPDGPLAGEAVALTGTFHDFSRAAARQTIRAAGGTLVGRVDDATTLLVVGSAPNLSATKLAAARKRGLPILDEAAFLARLNRRG